MSYKGKNVLVTGSAGLVGHGVTRQLLQAGANVRATMYKNRKLSIEHLNLTTEYCELMDFDQCMRVTKDIDIVFNCAAYIRGAKGQSGDPMALVRNNVVPAINMIEAACKNKVDRFGFIGSSTMYPNVSYAVEESEGFVSDPCDCYTGVGWMKRYCEKMCMYYHKLGPTKFAIIRGTAIYGPHDNFSPDQCHVIPALILKTLRQDDPLKIWGDGNQIRDFCYIDDVAQAFLKCVDEHPYADPINIGTGEGTRVRDVVNYLVDIEGYAPLIEYQSDMPSMIPTRLVDVTKAKSILGWESKIPLRDGLAKTVDWKKASP